jgi:adenylate cyclase class 2
VRRYGEKGVVTLKGAAVLERGLKSRTELETRVASPEVLADILSSLGFLPLFRYEKFREVWSLGAAEVCLDETPLGRFVEIEGAEAAIHAAAAHLKLVAREFLTDSYPALWMASGRRGDMVFPPKARIGRARA